MAATVRDVEAVRAYWDSHPLGKQYVSDQSLASELVIDDVVARHALLHSRP